LSARPEDTGRQPWVHDLEIAAHGNLTCVSDRSGDLDSPGTGLFADDRRVVTRWTLTAEGQRPVRVSSHSSGATTRVLSVARNLGDEGPDPTIEVHRRRRLVDGGLREEVALVSRWDRPLRCRLRLEAGGDGADLRSVKGGHASHQLLTVEKDGETLTWRDDRHETTVHLAGAEAGVTSEGSGVLEWDADLAPGGEQTWTVEVGIARTSRTGFDANPGGHLVDWTDVRARATDRRLDLVVAHNFADLSELVLADPDSPSDAFAAAGTPWYLTLFGRDSLWAARLTLPFGTDLAAGTLRTLARRQGRVDDPSTEEQPGKILHEVRRSAIEGQPDERPDGGRQHLPPRYYGTVDATPLWVVLVHDAWRWGLADEVVRELRPHLDAALGWIRHAVAVSPDGFLRYVDSTGTGLSNQGWKDSGDAMRRRDGTIAEAPIALVETQAYAVAAATGAAELLERVFAESGDDLRAFAHELAERVRKRFWVRDEAGPYLAMALDRHGDPVDAVGSNMGHVLATGTLTDEEGALVAARLSGPDLLGPFGVGTLGRDNPAYNPIGYHTGSVWTHDTAIAALGLARAGHPTAATDVLRALVDAATHFDFRFPELFGGSPEAGLPVPYPASCRPQAWAAASAGALVTASLGLEADVPRGCLRVRPLQPAPFGDLRVRGLRVRGEPVEIDLDAGGQVLDVRAPAWLDVQVG
jgi:glycogen debranching enzyme